MSDCDPRGVPGGALACASVRPSRRTSRTAFADLPPEPDDPLLAFAPYLHLAPRRNSITPDRQRAFIAALAATGIVTQAAREIGASLEALYKLRHRKGAEEFSAAWDLAIDRGVARLEDCAVELALRGEELPIVSAGKLLGTYRKHNFGHIRFMLSQRRAERYAGHGGGALMPEKGSKAYEALRAEWQAEYEAERLRQSSKRHEANERFLIKLNRRLGELRAEAVAVGAMTLLPDGRGVWADPELVEASGDATPRIGCAAREHAIACPRSGGVPAKPFSSPHPCQSHVPEPALCGANPKTRRDQ